MCRLFAKISTSPVTITKHVIESEYSILRQVMKEGHRDGWGAFFYDGNEVRLHIRSTNSLESEADVAKALLNSRASKASGFFVRKASNPLNLKFDDVHTAEATQPFVHMNLSFMHNGSVERPDLVMSALRNPEILPQSRNDSEVYFSVFLTKLRESGSVVEAFSETENFIKDVGGTDPYSSLNSIVVYGGRLYAFNMYRKDYRGTVMDQDRDYFKMAYWTDGRALIVSSEPTDGSDKWNDLGNGKILEAWEEDGAIKHKIIEIKVI